MYEVLSEVNKIRVDGKLLDVVTKNKLIDDLLDVAIKENDKAAQNFINKFVDEQVEEESTAQTIVDRIKMMNGHNLIYLDDKLGERK